MQDSVHLPCYINRNHVYLTTENGDVVFFIPVRNEIIHDKLQPVTAIRVTSDGHNYELNLAKDVFFRDKVYDIDTISDKFSEYLGMTNIEIKAQNRGLLRKFKDECADEINWLYNELDRYRTLLETHRRK